MTQSRVGIVVRGAALAALVLLPSLRPLEAAAGREVFRAHVLGGTKVTTPAGSLPISSPGLGGSILLDFSPAETLASRDRPGAIMVTLGTAITYRVTANVTVTLPGDDKETFSGTLDLSTGHATTCKAATVSVAGQRGGTTVSVSSTVSCSESVVYMYFLTWASPFVTRMSTDFKGDKGHFAGGSATATTVYEFLEDELYLNSHTPYEGSPLVPGSKVTFTGDVGVALESKPTASVALRLFDQRGVLQGSSDFQPISRPPRETDDGSDKPYSLTMKDVPIDPDGPTELRLRAVVIDPSGAKVLMQSQDVVYPLKYRCSLEGALVRIVPRRAEDGSLEPYPYWMPDALVDLLDGDTPIPPAVKAQKDPQNPATESFFCFNLPASFDYTRTYSLRARLQDSEDVTKGRLAVFPTRDDKAQPISIVGRPFRLHKGVRNRQHLLVSAGALGLSGIDGEKAEAGAESYWHVWRQLNRMSASLPEGFQVSQSGYPIRLYLNREGQPPSYFCDNGSDVCPMANSIVMAPGPSMPGAHPSTLWHEFGHYLLHKLYGTETGPVPPDPDRSGFGHGGYYNAFTNDSIDEGFATFWAVHSNAVLENEKTTEYHWNEPKPNPRGRGFPIEANVASWDSRRTAPDAPCNGASEVEDLAFSGLLWDLVDTNQDGENAGDVTFTANGTTHIPYDTVSWDVRSLTTLLAASKPGTILRFHDALAGKLPADLTSVSGNPRGSGLSQLDELFVMHRMFWDSAPGDWKFELGETVGKTANSLPWYGCLKDKRDQPREPDPVEARPTREDLPPIPGSFIDAKFLTGAGKAVDGGTVQVEERFGPGLEAWNRVSLLTLEEGKVYFPMPPPQYPVQVTISVPGGSGPPVAFDSAYYASSLGKGDAFLSATFVVPPPAPVTTAIVPQRAAPGTRVTIFGKGFATPAGLNTVTFGSVPAPVSSVSDTELLVTVPVSLADGAFLVTVETSAGASVPLDFTVETPILALAPASYEFGTVYSGGSWEATFTVRNAGLADLTVVSAACTDPAFTVSSPKPPFTVEPGATQAVKVAFRPPREGSYGGTLSFVTNDPVRRVTGVSVSGSGDSQRSGPVIAASPAAVNFGVVAVGKSRTFDVWLKNAGSADLSVSAATSSSPAITFTPTPALPATLAAYGYVWLQLSFSPTAVGPISATLTASSSDPLQPSLAIPVRGEGVASTTSQCAYGIEPGRLSLGADGGSAQMTVTATSGCAWTAAVEGFVSATSNATGTGNATVTLSVPVNPGPLARSANVTVQGLVCRVDQDAPAVSSASFVPVVLSTAGAAGSFYTSELTLTNRGTSDAILELSYTPFLGEGAGTGTDVLPAGAQLIFPDALAYLRSLGIPIPDSGNRGGTVSVHVAGASSATAVAATVRTTTAVPQGRAGLSYPAIPRALSQPAYLCGLRQNGSDRSNVAVMNAGGPADGDITVRLTAFSGDPAAPQSKVLPDIGLSPGGFSQVSQVLASNGLSMTNGYVKAERVGGTAPFYAYGVINDQATSDGSFVPPVLTSSLAGKAGVTLPVAVETGSFSTEVVLTNFGSAAKAARLTFVASAVQAPGNAASLDLSLAPGEQRVIPSFVQELRSRGAAGVGPAGPTFVGAVFLTVPGGDVSGLAIGARTSSPGGGGRFGLFYTGVPYGSAASATAWLYGLQQNDDNRSNLAIVNTGETDGSSSTFRIELFDGTSRALVKTIDGVSVAARGFGQLSSILGQYALGTSSAYARVTRVSGTNPFLCYAVINDGGVPNQRSDDGAFVPMDTGEEAVPQPALSVSPASLDFGSVAVGQTADRTLDVANAGTAALHVSSLAASGAGFGLVSAAAPFTVAPSGRTPVTVRFAPAAAGAASGTLTIASDDPTRPSLAVPLSGTGTAAASPVLEVSPPSLEFGKVNVGSGKDLGLTLRNAGGAPLVVSTLFVDHPAFTLSPPALPTTLAPGSQLALTLRFAPLAAGVISISLAVGTNDPARPVVYVGMQGEGVAVATVTEELATDDGSIETGFRADGYFVVNRLTPARFPATLKSIRLYYAQYNGLPSPAGTQVRVVAFADPTGSGTPAPLGAYAVDQTVTLPAVPAGGGGWIDLLLTNGPVVASGDIYVGLRAPSAASGVAFPADTNGTARRRGYFSADNGATWAGPLVLVDNATGAQTEVNVMIRAQVSEPAP